MSRWPMRLLGDVTECLDHKRIPLKASEREQRPGSIPYYGANGQVGWIDDALFCEPLLLIAEDGGHFHDPSRGVAYVIAGPSWVNNHAHVLRPNSNRMALAFLGHYFRHFDFSPYITGTTRAKLTRGDLLRVPVPIPPLSEQERIVRLLDEADAIRKLRARADQRTAELIPALFHQMFGDPVTNPMGWPVKKLGDLVKFQSGGTPARNNSTYWNGDIPWVSPKDMKSVDIRNSQEHISDGALIDTSLRLVPESTVLVVVRGMILAHTFPVGLTTVPVVINQDMKALIPIASIETVYLCWALRSQHAGILGTVSTAGHGTKRLPTEALSNVLMPVPPRKLQQKFARFSGDMAGLQESQRESGMHIEAEARSLLGSLMA